MAKVLLLMFGVFSLLSLVSLSRCESKDPIVMTLQSLDDSEKQDFLCYVLGLSLLDSVKNQPPRFPKLFPILKEEAFLSSLNISEEKINQFRQIDIPEESRKKLLRWTRSEFGLTGKDVLAMIRTKQCQGPNCIGLGDLGPLCCPW